MSHDEEEFLKKLMATFKEEADEHLQVISTGLLSLENGLAPPDEKKLIDTIFREAHSLKGAARSVNLKAVQSICQRIEGIFSEWKLENLKLTKELFDLLHSALEAVKQGITAPIEYDKLSQLLDALTGAAEQKKTANPEALLLAEQAHDKTPSPLEKSQTHSEPQQTSCVHPAVNDSFSKNRDKSVRISIAKLNTLFQQVEEMLVIKLLAEQQAMDLKNLFNELESLKKDFQKFIKESQQDKYFFLEGNEKVFEWQKKLFLAFEKQELALKQAGEKALRSMKQGEQNAHLIDSMVDTSLEEMKKILMQPMSTLFDTVPLMVRDLASTLGKEVEVKFSGGAIELDRRVLEQIKDPLIHLIRNAIDHGIESPQERKALQKPSSGTLKIYAIESDGNRVKLSISDDGKGVDVEKVKLAAIAKGLFSHAEIDEMSEESIKRLIFHSNISTAEKTTELSGRGLGMGIVSEKIDNLGGQLEIETEKGVGTTFTLILPLTLSTFRGVHILVSDKHFILPTQNIKRVLRLKNKDVQMAENRETILLDEHLYSYIHLSQLLSIEGKRNDHDFFFALIVKAGEQTMALGADYVFSESEILVKGFEKQSIKLKNIMAATVMERGDVIPILNPSELINNAIQSNHSPTIFAKEAAIRQLARKKDILLAEDSVTTRLLIKNILTSEKYDVRTAVDGKEAFDILQTEKFDLLITDVEMPRMDGFTLTAKVREIESLKNLPIIICSALGSEKDKKRGVELGANAYIDKNSFTQHSLLEAVQKLM